MDNHKNLKQKSCVKRTKKKSCLLDSQNTLILSELENPPFKALHTEDSCCPVHMEFYMQLFHFCRSVHSINAEHVNVEHKNIQVHINTHTHNTQNILGTCTYSYTDMFTYAHSNGCNYAFTHGYMHKHI